MSSRIVCGCCTGIIAYLVTATKSMRLLDSCILFTPVGSRLYQKAVRQSCIVFHILAAWIAILLGLLTAAVHVFDTLSHRYHLGLLMPSYMLTRCCWDATYTSLLNMALADHLESCM